MTGRWSLALYLAVAVPILGAPAVAVAGPTESDATTVRVVVDAKLGDNGPAIENVVAPDLRAAVEQAGYELDDSVRADATVRVRISYFNDVNLDYQVDVDIAVGAELVRLETLPCPQCADNVLLGKIDDHLPTILDNLGQALAKAGDKPAPASDDGEPATTQDPPPPSKPLHVLGGVGIGVAAVGIGALIAGGVELGRGLAYDDVTRTPTERTGVDHRPAGGALVGAGAVVLVAGVSMLVFDLVRSSKDRRRDTGRAHPLLGPNFAGLGYSGRF